MRRNYFDVDSSGRIVKCLHFNFDIVRPTLFAKGLIHIINYCHLNVRHAGTGTTLNYRREQGYGVLKDRATVKTELSSSTVCRKYNALVIKYPKFPNERNSLYAEFGKTLSVCWSKLHRSSLGER